MREDIEVLNDANGWSIWSLGLGGRTREQAAADVRAAAADEVIVPLQLSQDDTQNVRLVVGEALTADEEAGWVAHAAGVLRVPDGRIVISGGFDSGGGEPETDDYCQVRDVEPGRYQVDVYTFAGGETGLSDLLREVGREAFGAYARGSGSTRIPRWALGVLVYNPEYDPGREEYWQRVGRSELFREFERARWQPLSAIVRLTPLDEEAVGRRTPGGAGGWIPTDAGARVPEVCPGDFGFGALAGAEAPTFDPDLAEEPVSEPENPTVRLPNLEWLKDEYEEGQLVADPLAVVLFGGGPVEVVHTGAFGRYFHTSPEQVDAGADYWSPVDEEPKTEQEAAMLAVLTQPLADLPAEVAALDARLAERGLEIVGEFVVEAMGGLCIRAWRLADQKGYLFAYRSRPFEEWENFEVVVDYPDGDHVAFCTCPGQSGKKDRIVFLRFDARDAVDLLDAIRRDLAKLDRRHDARIERTTDLRDLCVAVDGLLVGDREFDLRPEKFRLPVVAP